MMKNKWVQVKGKLKQYKKAIWITLAVILVVFGVTVGTIGYAVAKSIKFTEKEAVDQATNLLNGTVLEIKRDNDLPVTYEMTVETKEGIKEIEMDAKTGKIIKEELEDGIEAEVVQVDAKINLDKAKKIAMKEINGVITEHELEYENEVLVYQFEIIKDKQGYDVVIDASSGQVISVQQEN